MNRTTKAGLYIMAAAVVIGVLGIIPPIIFGDSGGFISIEFMIAFLALYVSVSSFTVGVVVFMIGLTLKKPAPKSPEDTPTHANTPQENAPDSEASQPAPLSSDNIAIRLYVVAGAAMLINLVMQTVPDETHQGTVNGIIYLAAFLPLELVATLAPLAGIALGGIGAVGAESSKLKLMGVGLAVLGFVIYITAW